MTIRSMTGYGQASSELGEARVTVELRSLNHRFSDIRLRLPPELAGDEREIRRKILERVKRGRLEMIVNVEPLEGQKGGPQLNQELLKEVLAASRTLHDEFQIEGRPDLQTVLSLQGMFRANSMNFAWEEKEREALQHSLATALQALDEDRCREGLHLQKDLARRLATMSEIVVRIRGRAELLPAAIRDRLLERLQAMANDVELDPARVAQEAVLLADRSDLTEELVRLEGHLEQARGLLARPDGQPLGKRLDFLVQEINRETNTVNSKSADLDISRDALALKAELEKVREQVQNVE